MSAPPPPALDFRGATIRVNNRPLWQDLTLRIPEGELWAVLGPNGSGKSTLLKAVLGLRALTSGSLEVLGNAPTRGNRRVGYVPQQKLITAGTWLRGTDLVRFGVDGHRFGPPVTGRATRSRVERLIELVDASSFARRPVAELSGGEQQRLRIAQALAGDPRLLLCDEPLLSLDLRHQHAVSELIDSERRRTGAAVLFVTHDINPILHRVDGVIYLARGGFRAGTPDEVLRSDVLSDLYDTRVEVIRSGGRIVVAGLPDGVDDGGHHLHEAEAP